MLPRQQNIMHRSVTTKTTAYVFYIGITTWVLGLIIGILFQLPYIQKPYGLVTPLVYAGGLILLLALCNLMSRRAWRGHHRVASRNYEPALYWAIVGTMLALGAVLLIFGILNWFNLKP